MIRTEAISGIIVVVRHWNSLLSKYGSPILRLVAVPSLEMFPTASIVASGSVLSDIWDPIPESLARLRVTNTVTPVLVSSGGFPCPLNTPILSSVLESVQGLVLHSVEDLVTPISLPDGPKHVCCWIFPAGTNITTGIAWKLSTDLTLDKLISSVKDVHKTAYAGFFQNIAVASNFAVWINAATVEASKFQVNGIPLSDIDGNLPPLPALDAMPLSISCLRSIYPWVHMR